jgi:hypothetical protein
MGTAVLAFLLSGCALNVELESTPDPVQSGDDVTFTIRATNVTSCTLPGATLRLLPLLTPEDEAVINDRLMNPPQGGISVNFTVEQLCELAAAPRPSVPADLAAQLSQLSLSPPAIALAAEAEVPTGESAVCAPGEEDGIAFFDCTIGPLASGATVEFEVVHPASDAGTLRSVLLGTVAVPGVCVPGTNGGNACRSDGDCAGADSCGNGFCSMGDNAGLGCDDDGACPGDGGTCVDCARCASEGFCTAGEREGEGCFLEDDCPTDSRVIGVCRCGIPFACDSIEVLPPPTPTSTPTLTPTHTPTGTPVPDGGSCTETAQCEPLLVCTDGICQRAAPAPQLSPAGLGIALGLLVGTAALALRRRVARGPGTFLKR